mmetsp:Transcript_6685/g.11578  ORF Transcript_6685/g.11578 Transcript_6685/m.11578 type:complete len:105 (-) Transcript_6685:1210-1524(-)
MAQQPDYEIPSEIWNHEKFKSSRPLVLEICRLLREKNKESQPSTQSSNSSSSVPGSQYSNPAPANSAPLTDWQLRMTQSHWELLMMRWRLCKSSGRFNTSSNAC